MTNRYGFGLGLALAVCLTGVSIRAQSPFMRWDSVNKGLELRDGAGVQSVAAGGKAPVVYAAAGKDLYRSDDLGGSWVRLAGKDPVLSGTRWVAAAPDDGKCVFAAAEAAGAGLYRSADGGATWTHCDGLASEDVESVAVCAQNPKVVLAGQRDGNFMSSSADGGVTWTKHDLGGPVKGQVVIAISEAHWTIVGRAEDKGVRVTIDGGQTWAAGEGDTQHHQGGLVVAQTGETLLTTKHHGFNKSTDGGRTWAYTMEMHTRMVGTAGPMIFRESNRAVREGYNVWILQMSDNEGVNWQEVTLNLTDAIASHLGALPAAFTNMSPFQENRQATAWASTPDGTTVFLGLGAAGLYRGRLMSSSRGPLLGGISVHPGAVREGDTKTRVQVRAVASSRTDKVRKVSADLRAVGGGDLELFDDGMHEDGEAGDKTYGNAFTLGAGVKAGEKIVGVVAEDDKGRLNSAVATIKISAMTEKMTVWDGDRYARGQSWVSPQTPLNFIKAQGDEMHSGKIALEFRGEGSGYIGGGWNWHGWYPDGSGEDISGFANLTFWVKIVGDDPQGFSVALVSATTKKGTGKATVAEYAGDDVNLRDGAWHEVVIPLKDMYAGSTDAFDPHRVWELDVNSWAPKTRAFSVYIDDIGFDNRPVRSHLEWASQPGARPAAVLKNPVVVTADVDVKNAGQPISPWIYGIASGDIKAAQEMGVTMRRAGGNPVTPVNWKKGFGAKGADWFYENEGKETPPEQNWLVTFHGNNQQAGLGTYLTMPIMGRVAKDGSSAAFDTNKYADQDDWAGKSQPTDRLPNAGSGRRYVRGKDGQIVKDKDGKSVTELIEPDPNDTSVEMSPDEQCEMLSFMIDRMKYGTAVQGGVKYIALDNEPMIWYATHRGMHPKGTSYDEYWQRTVDYAGRLKKIDPGVKIAGPTLYGWTAYHVSGLDLQVCGGGKASWTEPPDFTAHGRVPFSKWWMKKLAEYEKANGVRLVDILDFHFYPQTGIYMGGTPNDPKVMEGRVQETRVLWDPDYVDPSWMAGDEFGKAIGGKLQILRMMKSWIAECNPGMQTALGEYSWSGEKDISGGVAQAELLGIFAREGLDFAFYWYAPEPNSSPWFGFKMFRNPDGNHTTFGDRYLPSAVSAPTDVSVHTAKDSKTGRLTFVLVNKRASKDAKVTLKLNQAVPKQEVVAYEYSAVDRYMIGQRPAQTVEGTTVTVDLPSLSVVRFDLKP